MERIVKIRPQEIEAESFRIIAEEFEERTGKNPGSLDPKQFAVIRRAIHATGDFSFAASFRFHDRAIEAGLAAIRSGKNILTDVNMASAGISRSLLAPYGGKIICRVAETAIAELARMKGKTRSETAVEEGIMENVGIVAIGNAPTALLAVMKLIKEGRAHPDLIIGVPVGFVNAEESKEILHEQDYPYITSLGRKGGTAVSVAIVNALLRLL
ncbi:MAG: precorrin-8X methylmutase [Proteobacteria bacterium]|nr:precorrin-8X methylmutase [Pseudomonadota bacterium]MBU1059507.1 precorrin-8X methylmutase [Pseudomonadota bacterium]